MHEFWQKKPKTFDILRNLLETVAKNQWDTIPSTGRLSVGQTAEHLEKQLWLI